MPKPVDPLISDYEITGMAAMLSGMQHLLRRMQEVVQEHQEKLDALQRGAPVKPESLDAPQSQRTNAGYVSLKGLKKGTAEYRAVVTLNKRIEREGKHGGSLKSAGVSAYWAKFTPEERSAEMKRRMAITLSRKAGSPVNKDHPDHAAWVAKMARMRRRAWNQKTEAEKNAWKAKMAAGKVKAAATTKRSAA
jgi:hypothetical protein